MRAPPSLIPALLALLASVAGTLLAARAATSPTDSATGAAAPAAAAAQLSAQATPLFNVTPAPRCKEALCFWANSDTPGASLTLSRTHMVMINPEIVDTTRGIAHITADRGEESGPEVRNSRWVFTGHIRADMSDGQLRADMATVQIVDGRIVSIDAQGSPALFQRPASAATASNAAGKAAARASVAPAAAAPATASGTGAGAAGKGTAAGKAGLADITVRGHADSITYDAAHDRVQFSGDSWFTDGCNELTSQLVTYDMQTQTVQAGAKPGGNGRVRGVIRNTRPGSASACTADSGSS
ncbi:MAG TPA: LptA/OstA family protein [Steroidobacteraceae bacterium]|nr:LptA/OstA family protein [Steroidobacteraceae bacterium]